MHGMQREGVVNREALSLVVATAAKLPLLPFAHKFMRPVLP